MSENKSQVSWKTGVAPPQKPFTPEGERKPLHRLPRIGSKLRDKGQTVNGL